jgi:hypothetical protein
MTPAQAPDQGAAMSGSARPPHPYDQRWYLHLNSKTHGPYAGHQLRQMVEQHQIVASDFVYAEGGTAWRQIADDPILGVLFKSANPRRAPVVPRTETSPGFRKWLFVIPVLVIAGWIGWPYYSFYKLAVAFHSGDIPTLESGVAWDSVRQGLRSDLTAAFLQSLSNDANKGHSAPRAALDTGLAGVMGPVIVDKMLEAAITPQAIAAISSQKNIAPKDDTATSPAKLLPGGANWHAVEYMFFSGNPFTFKVQVRPDRDPPLKSPFTFIFNWSGDWKLTRFIPPSDVFEAIDAASKQNVVAPKLSDLAQMAGTKAAEPDKTDEALLKAKQDYIKNLEIYDFKARYRDSILDGRIPGVEFKIKNNGSETLDEVKVTVYFKNAKGNTIAEEDYFPVLVSSFSLSNNKPLKPNYIWQMERGKFYGAKSVPSEWKEGEAEIRITDLRFGKADSTSAEEQKLPSTPAKRVPAPTQISKGTQEARPAENSQSDPQSEIKALRARISSCWSPPPGIDAHSKLYVVLRVSFNPDGSMVQATLIEGSASVLGPALVESAKRALLLCQPFTMLNPEHYDQWKDLELRFDPRELLGG